MKERRVKVGFVTLSRTTFSLDFARDIHTRSVKILESTGVNLISYPQLVVNMEDAQVAAQRFREEEVDLLVIQNGTFAAADLTVELATGTQVPIILWAIPEPEVNGARLLANSLCGVNLNANVLANLKKKYWYFYAMPEDDSLLDGISVLFRMMHAYVNLKNSRIGWVGMRCPGYYCSATDEVRLRRVIGPSLHHIDLLEVSKEMEKIKPDQAIEHVKEVTKGRKVEVSSEKLEKMGRLSQALYNIKDKYEIDALAVKCWPEFPEIFQLSPCATVSWLNDAGIPTSCEGDVEGAATMLLHKFLTGQQSFFADLIKYDKENNTSIFWHCGSAPSTLGKKDFQVEMHEDFKGVGVTVEFPLKPGEVTISRIATIDDDYRVLLGSGEALNTELLARGTPLRVKMHKDGEEFLNTVIYQGFPHHYVLGYQNRVREIKELAQLWGLKVV